MVYLNYTFHFIADLDPKADMPSISVIVPIFNTEKYVEKCVRSIMEQSFKDIEIICVDDMSTDSSFELVHRLSLEDPRIKLIRHTQNIGLGGARNSGIRASLAPYIASVDSDDCIKPEMLSTLWDETENGKIDVISFGFDRIDEKNKIISSYTPKPRIEINDNNSINIFGLVNPAFWNKLWRKNLYTFNDIWFPNHVFYQDLATTPRIFAKSRSIKIIDRNFYNYLVRSDSITNTNSPKHATDFVRVFETLCIFLVHENLWDRYANEYYAAVDSAFQYHGRNVIRSNMSHHDKISYLKTLLAIKIGIMNIPIDLLGGEYDRLELYNESFIKKVHNSSYRSSKNASVRVKLLDIFGSFSTKFRK